MLDTEASGMQSLFTQAFTRSDHGWFTILAGADGADGQFDVVVMGDDAPSVPHLHFATTFINNLPQLRPTMEAALLEVPETDPLFPPRHARQWYLESIMFCSSVPEVVDVRFSLEESAFDYIYVVYHVEMQADTVIRCYAVIE